MKGDDEPEVFAVPIYAERYGFLIAKGAFMDTRVAVISIIVEERDSVETLNAILHEHSGCIIGRMGIPYQKKDLSIICIAVDAPQDMISSLSGKIGKLKGVTVKTAYSKVSGNE